MKTLILTLALLAPTFASASSMDELCSNASATVKMEGGHRNHFWQLTKREYTNEGVKETPVIFDRENLDQIEITDLANSELDREQRSTCRDGLAGYYGKTTSARKVRITKTDGLKFSDDFVGVTKDGAVEAYLVCEMVITSIHPCSK